jgi:hypothetical protein
MSLCEKQNEKEMESTAIENTMTGNKTDRYDNGEQISKT